MVRSFHKKGGYRGIRIRKDPTSGGEKLVKSL